MDLVQPIAKHIIDPLVALREGSSYRSILKELELSQYWTSEQIKSLQLERLRALLLHAGRHCPYYADLFARSGFKPERLSVLSDLASLPVLTKRDIQAHNQSMVAANIPDSRLVPNQTGGSTGSPLRFFLDKQRLYSRKASTVRHDRWAGLDVGHKLAVLWGNRHDFAEDQALKARLKHRLYDRRIFLDTSDMSQSKIDGFIESLKAYRPSYYLAYANSIYLLARYIREKNIADYHRPLSIITSAELLTDEQRALIESVFECKIFNRYGCRETSVIASECSEHDGMHVCAETLLVEFVRQAGADSSDNAAKIVITDLLNYGMPLIRYQIEDMGSPVIGPCRCGRGLPRMNISGGRVTDFLVTPDNRVISGAAMTIYFIATVPGIAQAQIIQERKDFMVLKLVKGGQFSDKTLQLLDQKVQEFFGNAMKYEIDFVEDIPKTASGKYRFSICKLDPMEYLG